MERNIVLTILALVLLAIGIAVIVPGGRQADPEPKLPWNITVHPDGTSTVFTLHLETSTLGEARDLLEDGGKLTLFADKEGNKTLEAYFERIVLSGLRADMVMTLDLSQDELQALYDRGARAAKIGSGETKITLNTGDEQASATAPIRHITYLPVADLEADLLESRFGTPTQRIPGNNGVEHWLYPDKGLEIAYDPDRKEVFQYISPKDFQTLVTDPLEKAAAEREAKKQAESMENKESS